MNSVDMVLMEQFDLNPLGYLEIGSSHYFEDGSQFMEDVMKEASTPTPKQGVLGKIWNTIKKIFAWIAKQWTRFTKWIGKLLGRKSKTADQCLDEALSGTEGGSNKTGAAEPTGTDSKTGEGKPKSVSIPFNPTPLDNSVDVNETITLAYKDIQAKIEGDQVIFYPHLIREGLAKQQPDQGGHHVPANGETRSSFDAMVHTFHMLEHPDRFQEFVDIVAMLQNKEWENGLFNASNFAAKVTSFTKDFNGDASVKNNIALTMEQINQFNAKLTDLNKALDFYDDPNKIPGGSNPLVVQALNNLATIAFKLQFGMNMITGSMNGIYTVDARYIGVIDSNEKLAKFVDLCIKGNIPTKYIAWNAWAVCSDQMKGSADQKRPAMGQSRLVIFPTGANTVTKIATNQYGVRANNAELMVTNSFKKVGVDDIIARVEKSYNNSVVIEAEKADTSTRPTNRDINEVRDKLDVACDKAQVTINISSDIHGGNVGIRDGKWIATDYGFTER